jgi:hypothetical protein|uniref:Uncharacterized protein n=1 Tax=viral metagenome TaxID=1070528 RepID=A0A6C0BFM4_9ZZZZ
MLPSITWFDIGDIVFNERDYCEYEVVLKNGQKMYKKLKNVPEVIHIIDEHASSIDDMFINIAINQIDKELQNANLTSYDKTILISEMWKHFKSSK